MSCCRRSAPQASRPYSFFGTPTFGTPTFGTPTFGTPTAQANVWALSLSTGTGCVPFQSRGRCPASACKHARVTSPGSHVAPPVGAAEAVLAALDPEQRTAVLAVRGPVCILAGAGTGKTRTITHRVAYGVLTGMVPAAHGGGRAAQDRGEQVPAGGQRGRACRPASDPRAGARPAQRDRVGQVFAARRRRLSGRGPRRAPGPAVRAGCGGDGVRLLRSAQDGTRCAGLRRPAAADGRGDR